MLYSRIDFALHNGAKPPIGATNASTARGSNRLEPSTRCLLPPSASTGREVLEEPVAPSPESTLAADDGLLLPEETR